MNRHLSLTLDDELADFVEAQITTGRYGAADDVLEAGLRLLAREAAHLDALRSALVEGEDSGPSTPFDFDAFLAERSARETPRT